MILIQVGDYYINPEAIAALAAMPNRTTRITLIGGAELNAPGAINQVVAQICAATGQDAKDLLK